MRCYHKILRISYKDHVTNEEVRAKIQQVIGPHEDLLTIAKRRKLQWCGHVSRSSGLAKTTLQGGGRQGRQRKRWGDNIIKWAGLEFTPSPGGQWRTGKNGGNWLWNHLWCPNEPCGLGINDDDDESFVAYWAESTNWQTVLQTKRSVYSAAVEEIGATLLHVSKSVLQCYRQRDQSYSAAEEEISATVLQMKRSQLQCCRY